MKFLVLAVFAFLVFTASHFGSGLYASLEESVTLAAAFINDSIIVDLQEEGASTEVVPEADSTVSPSSGGGGETVTFSDGGGNDGSDGAIGNVTVTTGGSSDDATHTGDGTGSEETISAQDLLNTLTGSQAVTTSSGDVHGGSNGSGSSGVGTSVSGSKTREALLSRNITRVTIPPPPEVGGDKVQKRPPYSRTDLALIVSSELVKNPDIDDVFFTTQALTITYKARGRLFWALPVPYTTTLALKFDEATAKKRVLIRFPWYKFMMWTGVSKNNLRNQIDALITTAPLGDDYDRAALIFEGVAEILSGARGTVSGSVRTVQ